MKKMYELSDYTKKAVEEKTGMKFEDVVNSDWEVIDKNIEKKIKKKLKFNKNGIDRYLSRGSVYISTGRLLDIDEYEKKVKMKR